MIAQNQQRGIGHQIGSVSSSQNGLTHGLVVKHKIKDQQQQYLMMQNAMKLENGIYKIKSSQNIRLDDEISRSGNQQVQVPQQVQ